MILNMNELETEFHATEKEICSKLSQHSGVLTKLQSSLDKKLSELFNIATRERTEDPTWVK